MKRLGFLLVLFSFLLACKKDYSKINHPYKFIPNETSAVIQVNELNDFINSIENHEILSGIYNKELKNVSNVLKNLNTTQQVFIAFTESAQNQSDYLILTKNDSVLFVVDSISNSLSESLVDFKIEKTQIDSIIVYHKVIGNIFAGSNNLEVLKKLNLKKENTELSKLIETSDKKSVASIVFKSDSPDYSKLLFLNFGNKQINTNYSILDLNYTSKSLQYNGILSSNDSILDYLDSFKKTIPQKTNTPKLAPYNTSSLVSISYDDFSVFNKNLIQFRTQTRDSTTTFLNFTNEIALIDNAVLLYTLDPNLILESIEEKSNIDTFRDIDIYQFGDPQFFKSRLLPYISYDNSEFFTVYNNFIVFSNSIESIKFILTNALNNNTLANWDAFKSISKNLSDEASLFIFKNSDGLSEILEQDIKGYNANAVQFIYDDNYAHVNGVIQKFKKRATTNSVTEAFSIQLDAELLTAPQTLKNHVTKAHDIAVQDVNNVLYLISDSGNTLWKKQLHGKILGDIKQIDMYKNGRFQIAFATSNRLYILDRNGNDVSSFPLKFNDVITQPLSVFDYDKRKNYRLLITQSKNLLMYNVKGKSVSGFNYKNNGSDIASQPKHFRIGSKDYIVFGAGETLKILNRQGKVRINVKDKIRFSDKNIYLYQNKFTTTNTLGQLIQVDTRGKLNTKNLNLTGKHYIATTSKTLVALTENRLIIKSRTVDLDYGDYTAPKIFYINDKIYITTTDLQSKKVYLFDSQAKSIPNFPVFGTSTAELQKLDNENGLELIVKSDAKSIVVYKLH
ncbi:ribonuclease HII [uncultured Winogradskyella sp.]|uniref:ribonuclease HII n=1 Tax=uncultured Winogradskyella sp. TaxID=395353 RepID=UPI0030D97B81|tara:strand:- start:3069 stop:5441 length:2373 start_codon:yes stop_codon:yes gene_type:complete